MKDNNIYLKGEEKFGFFTSYLYGFSRLIPTFKKFHLFVIADILENNFKNILDIGCGNGYLLNEIVKRRKDTYAVGIDPSRYMLKHAEKLTAKNKLSDNIKFVLGSNRTLLDEKFDFIYTSMSFHHWKDRELSIVPIISTLNSKSTFNIYEMENKKRFADRISGQHKMKSTDFQEIEKSLNIPPVDLLQKNNFIRASFRRE